MPNVATNVLDYDELGRVIKHIMESVAPLDTSSKLVAPDFDEKIQFNGLSEGCATYLRFGSYQAGSIEGYFKLNTDNARQQLRDKINAV